MKKLVLLSILFVTTMSFAQNFYAKKGIAIEGYDVTEYHNEKAIKGDKSHAYEYQGATFYFISKENKEKFIQNPEKYIPEYGGYCAYAVAEKGEKISINPKTFELKDGKVYLFYNSFGINTLKKWNENNPHELQKKADNNWVKLKN